MLTVTLAQLKNDIAGKMKGTSIREVKDFYGTTAGAANRMLARIDTEETRRTYTMSTPFWDNINDYTLPTDFKAMIDIRPQANRTQQPGDSHYEATSIRQFRERLTPDSFAIQWNNGIRTLKAQVLPSGNNQVIDEFNGSTSNGAWAATGDASGLYTEPVNYVNGNSSLGLNLSGATGLGYITNTTAAVLDLSAYNNEDASALYIWIPSGFSSRFTSFTLARGDDASNYRSRSVTTKADGTAFTDGWNLLLFNWSLGTNTGSPTNTKNTYEEFTMTYSVGAAINGFLIDSWTNALGTQYEIEYYSECLFKDASTGAFKYTPTADSDIILTSIEAYEILKYEIMTDVIAQIRTGAMLVNELDFYHKMLNGDPETRYVKNPPFHGSYWDYINAHPSSRIVTATAVYNFDV